MKRSVSNLLAKGFFNQLKDSGVSRAENILEKCGISIYELNQPEGRITENNHYKLINEVYKHKDLIDDAMFSSCDKSDILALAHLAFPELIGYNLNQETILAAISSFVENRFVIGDCDSIAMIRNDHSIKITYINEGPKSIEDMSAVGNFMMLYKIARQYTKTGRVNIGFTGLHSQDGHYLNNYFESKCQFNSNENFIIFENDSIETNKFNYNKPLNILQKDLLLKKKESIYHKATFSSTISDVIEKTLARVGANGTDVSILENVCSAMNMSRWTLNERLKSENTSFSDLLKALKVKMSCHLLSQTNKSIQEISELACFSSISAFSRFFNSNLNMSPLSYRKIFAKI